MKSIICENFGPLNSLVYKEVETPEIQNPSDVLIKVLYFHWILINSGLKLLLYGPRIRINHSPPGNIEN